MRMHRRAPQLSSAVEIERLTASLPFRAQKDHMHRLEPGRSGRTFALGTLSSHSGMLLYLS